MNTLDALIVIAETLEANGMDASRIRVAVMEVKEREYEINMGEDL